MVLRSYLNKGPLVLFVTYPGTIFLIIVSDGNSIHNTAHVHRTCDAFVVGDNSHHWHWAWPDDFLYPLDSD